MPARRYCAVELRLLLQKSLPPKYPLYDPLPATGAFFLPLSLIVRKLSPLSPPTFRKEPRGLLLQDDNAMRENCLSILIFRERYFFSKTFRIPSTHKLLFERRRLEVKCLCLTSWSETEWSFNPIGALSPTHVSLLTWFSKTLLREVATPSTCA